MKNTTLRKVQVTITMMMVAFPALGDWINLTGAQSEPNIAEIYIEDDHVRLVLEIYVNDIDKFVDLLPDEWLKQAGKNSPPMLERMQRFSTDGLQVVVGNQQRLIAELKLAEPRLRQERPNPFTGRMNPYTRQPIPGPLEDKRVLYAELVYPFETRPAEITFVPPLDPAGNPAASLDFIAYRKEVPIVDYRYHSEPAKLSLDWQDPWYSKFENKALKRWQQSGICCPISIFKAENPLS